MSEVTCVAPWYGSNRMLAKRVAAELRGCNWVGVPFAGGLSEVVQMEARTINVNDLHEHVINLTWVMAHPTLGPKLYRTLRRTPFHPKVLEAVQKSCFNAPWRADALNDEGRLNLAINYFCCAWMTRHGSAGTGSEFTGGTSVRWNASGGDSAAHFQGAIRAIPTLRRTLRRCNFTTLDFREFLGKCKEYEGHGIYCDPPFPGPGDKYTHRFTDGDHEDLASLLAAYTKTRVVVRYYDVPFVRVLYPEPQWNWLPLVGRKQTNEAGPEVLIINGVSRNGGTP